MNVVSMSAWLFRFVANFISQDISRTLQPNILGNVPRELFYSTRQKQCLYFWLQQFGGLANANIVLSVGVQTAYV
jgi:hypothetical protein